MATSTTGVDNWEIWTNKLLFFWRRFWGHSWPKNNNLQHR